MSLTVLCLFLFDGPKSELESRLKSHVEYLASDAMKGRATPSPELESSAVYIADQFRSAGLKPLCDGYVQRFEIPAYTIKTSETSVLIGGQRLNARPVFPMKGAYSGSTEHLIVTENCASLRATPVNSIDIVLVRQTPRSMQELVTVVTSSASAILFPHPGPLSTVEVNAFFPPYVRPAILLIDCDPDTISSGDPAQVEIPASPATVVRPANVAAAIEGTSSREWILVGAHYDHVGHAFIDGFPRGEPDPDNSNDLIWNGANDNASSVAALIAMGRGLSRRPLGRGVLLVAFFGEESGLLGSRAYVSDPLIPIDNTVAMINLEQIGRTDELNLPANVQPGAFGITGFNYSTLPQDLSAIATRHGLKAYRHPRFSESYFGRSDNGPFASAGIPSHTISSTYAFPDYHGAADQADRLDYTYLAQMTRFLIDAVAELSNQPHAPHWASEAPQRYRR